MSFAIQNTVYFGAAAPASLSGASAKPIYVSELPETGKEGVLYLVPTGVTRDGYQIFQEFVWYNNGWKAIGAYDVGIDPVGIVYEDAIPYATSTKVGGIKQTFDASTGTWTVITDNI